MKTSAVSVESHTTRAVLIVSFLETIVLSVSPSRVIASCFRILSWLAYSIRQMPTHLPHALYTQVDQYTYFPTTMPLG